MENIGDLISRLRGKYSCGPDGIREDRDFGSYTPAICSEAADAIVKLRKQLAERGEAILLLSKSYSDWPMQVSGGQEVFISKIIDEIEKE